MIVVDNMISITDARANLPDLVSKVSDSLKRITITVSGQPKATLISADELESLEETAEVMIIPGVLKDIALSRKQIKNKKFVKLSDLK
jgi:antitoxin YefM